MDRTADIVIVGAGAAGLSAALTAVEEGLEVLVLEKQGQIGGSSILSGGSLAFAGTDIQSAQNISDSEEALIEDLRKVGQYENDENIVNAYARHQSSVYSWLDQLGVGFSRTLKSAPGSSVPRIHSADPATFLPLLLEKCLSSGKAEILYGAHAEMLATNPADQTVEGVLVGGLDSPMVRARKGVILATGGFTRANELIRRFAPNYDGVMASGGAGNTGDGLLMAWKLGADFVDVAYIQGNYGVHPTSGSLQPVHAIYKGAIAVNRKSRRFVDESLSYKIIADACVAQPGKVTYQIFDQNIFEQGDDAVPAFSFKSRLGLGQLLLAPSLGEIADLLGIPSDTLEESVRKYNAGVEGLIDDEFGRNCLAAGNGDRLKIERPPFYACPATVLLLGTYCGLRVTPGMQVVDVYGMEIPGLYAAGEVVGGLHGRGELPGTALGKAIIFGRLAALSIARQAE